MANFIRPQETLKSWGFASGEWSPLPWCSSAEAARCELQKDKTKGKKMSKGVSIFHFWILYIPQLPNIMCKREN